MAWSGWNHPGHESWTSGWDFQARNFHRGCRGQALPIDFSVRQPFGLLDVLINEGSVWLVDFQGL